MMFFQKAWHQFKEQHELQKIIINMNWLFLDTAIRMGIGFFVSVLVIRYLGPEKYGFLSYALALVAFFSIFSKLGLDSITVRELVVGRFKKEKLLGTVFYLKLWGGTLAVVLSVITAYFLKGDVLIMTVTAAISFTLIFQAVDVIDLWFQSRVMSKYVAYSRSIACIMGAAIKIWLVATNASLFWFAIVVLLESIFVASGFAIAYHRNKKDVSRWAFDQNVAKDLLKDSWPLILSAAAVMIYMRIDQIMIGNMLGYGALGNYTVAVGLSEMWYFIPMIITTSVFPAIIASKKKNEKLYYDRLQKLYDMMVWIAIAIAIPMTFLSSWIINLLYGAEYTQASDVLMIYVWAGIFVFSGVASGKWLVTENLQRYSFYFTGGASIVNVILNVILIKSYGINGAAYATLISYGASVMVIPLFFNKTRILTYMLFKSIVFFRIFSIKNN